MVASSNRLADLEPLMPEVNKVLRRLPAILELAVAARCDHVISFNKRDFAGAEKFGVTVLDPGTFLGNLGELPWTKSRYDFRTHFMNK